MPGTLGLLLSVQPFTLGQKNQTGRSSKFRKHSRKLIPWGWLPCCGVMCVTVLLKKMPDVNGGFTRLNFSKSDPLMYSKLTSDHPIDMCRYQVANGYMGRAGLI